MLLPRPPNPKLGSAANPVVTFSPVVLTVPGRQVDLQMKVSAPATGSSLPIILFSHGHGRSNFLSSLHGYGPLVDFYAAQGFVVIQPTHQSSKTLSLDPKGPEGALFWRSRATDMHYVLDHLDLIEATVPGLSGRMDHSRIAAVGHSMGGHTVGMLAGMRVTDPHDGKEVNLIEPRIKAGVMIGAPGKGADAAAFVSENYPVLRNGSCAEMTMPVLVVAGDKDKNANFSEREDWRADAYHLSPGPKCLLTIFGGEHILGGISGYDAAETTDDNPERVALVRSLTLAYLRSALDLGDTSWADAQKTLREDANPKASIVCK
jgi:dienelactone hydrolase